MIETETRTGSQLGAQSERERFWLGDWLVTPEACVLDRQEQRVHLEPRVMDVLCELCAHGGEIVSAEDLLTRIWRGTFYGDNPVHKSIAQLRRALGDSASAPEYIETVRKRGYRVITTVRHAEASPGRGSEPGPGWAGGNPFRGLQAFEEKHAGIFFGRDAAIGRIVTALHRQLDDELGLLLLLGPSGSGKTSLVRAGVLPLLGQRHGLNGLRALTSARLDVSGSGDDVLLGLATSLLQWQIDDRPVFLDAELTWLHLQLRDAPDSVVHRIQQAVQRARIGSADSGSRDLLVLTIDQSETVLAKAEEGDAELDDLAQVLDCFARSGCIVVLLTCRSDFYPVLLRRLPIVLTLKGEHGHIDLAPMNAGELALCIRGPARAAGLSFEVEAQTQLRLDDCLRDDAVGHPESLPLLQHALDSLYAQRSPEGRLGFDAYRQMGGLAGAIASRAEDVYARLDGLAQAALPNLLDRIVSLHPGHGELVARQLDLDSIDSESGQRLVEAFVEARLFVSVLEHGQRRFGIAHEALLRHWPRVSEWVERNRQRLQAHARIAQAAQRWAQDQRRDDLLLHSERQVGEARELFTRVPALFNDSEREFVRRSLRLNGRRRRLRAAALAVFLAVAAVAAVMGLRANLASAEAERRRQEAESLVEFLLGDLAERLRPLGRLDVLASVAERALQSLQPDHSTLTSSQALQQRARALSTLGEVLLDQGDNARAATAFEQAVETLRPLLESNRVDPELLELGGNLAYWLGYVEYRARNFESADLHWQNYALLSRRRMDKQPDEPRAWLELSYALNNLGTLARDQGRNQIAIDHFESSLALKRRYVDARPDDTAMQADLADSLSWLGSTLEREGREAEAAGLYAQELTIFEHLVSSEPRDARWHNRHAVSQVRNGVLALALNQVQDAERHLQEAVSKLTDLVERDPSNRTWQRDLAHARLQWSEALTELGHDVAAREQLQITVAAFDDLIDRQDVPVEWQRLALQARLQLLARAFDTDASERRLTELRLLAEDLERLWQQSSADTGALSALATAHVILGDAHHRLGQATDAHEHWMHVEQLLNSERHSLNRQFLEPLALALQRLDREEEATALQQRLIADRNRIPGTRQGSAHPNPGDPE